MFREFNENIFSYIVRNKYLIFSENLYALLAIKQSLTRASEANASRNLSKLVSLLHCIRKKFSVETTFGLFR